MIIKENISLDDFNKKNQDNKLFDIKDNKIVKINSEKIPSNILDQFTLNSKDDTYTINFDDKNHTIYTTEKGDVSKRIDKLKDSAAEKSKVSPLSERDFEKLGQYLVFKFGTVKLAGQKSSVDPDKISAEDFSDALSNAFLKADDAFKTIGNIEDALKYAAASEVLSENEKKIEGDKYQTYKENIAKYADKIREIDPKLFDQTKEKDEVAFQNGMEDYQKKLQDKDTKELVDPFTGKKQEKTLGGRTKNFLNDKGKEILQGIESKISGSKHTIFTDALRLAMFAVKGVGLAGKEIMKALKKGNKMGKDSLFKKISKLKVSELRKNVNKFIEEFNKAKKEKQLPENTSIDEFIDLLNEAEEQQQGEEINDKFLATVGEVVSYIYNKQVLFNQMSVGKKERIGNIDENGIISLEKSPAGNITLIQDKLNLYLEGLKVYKLLYEKTIKEVKSWKNMKFKDVMPVKLTDEQNDYKGIVDFVKKLEINNGKAKSIIENIENVFSEDTIFQIKKAENLTLEKFKTEADKYISNASKIKIENFEKDTKIENYKEIQEDVPASFDAEKFEENNEENIFEDLDLEDILPNLSVENKKLMFTKKDAEETIEVNKNSTEDLKEKIANENDFFNKWKEENSEKKKDVIELLNELAPETEEGESKYTQEQAEDALKNITLENAGTDKEYVMTNIKGAGTNGGDQQAYVYKDSIGKDPNKDSKAAQGFPFYDMFKKTYKDLFDKWAKEHETDEKLKNAVTMLRQFLGEETEENKDENIFGDLKTTEILDKLSLENDKVMFKKDDESEAIEIDQKNADVLKEMLTKNEEEFNKWKEENKEKKKDIIEKLNNLVGKADAVEPPPEIAKGIENAAKEMIAVNDHIDDEDFGKKYEKTKKDMEAVDKAVSEWADKNEKVYGFWDKILKTIGHGKEVLPLMWSLASLLRMKDILGEAIRMKNRMDLLKELNETEENQEVQGGQENNNPNVVKNKEETEEKSDGEIEKVKQLILSTDDILKKQKAEEFKGAYEEWISTIDKAVEHFKANEKYKEKIEKELTTEDPFEKICKLYKIITFKEEEKSEGNEGNEESNPDPRGDKNLGDQDSDGDDGMGDSFIRMSLHDYLMKALND